MGQITLDEVYRAASQLSLNEREALIERLQAQMNRVLAQYDAAGTGGMRYPSGHHISAAASEGGSMRF